MKSGGNVKLLTSLRVCNNIIKKKVSLPIFEIVNFEIVHSMNIYCIQLRSTFYFLQNYRQNPFILQIIGGSSRSCVVDIVIYYNTEKITFCLWSGINETDVNLEGPI